MLDNKHFFYDATPTWAGYNYQGSCGLLIAINKIIGLLLEDIKNISMLKYYSVEFEGMEDFSIKYEDEYIEIHQVKNYKKSGFSHYKDAIWLLLAKIEMNSTIVSANLHLTHELSNVEAHNNSDLFEKFKGYNLPSNISDNQRIRSYNTPRECYEYFQHKSEETKNKYPTIVDAYRENFQKFSIYKHRDGSYYCEDTEISEEIKYSIEEFLSILDENDKLNGSLTSTRIERIYNSLKAKLDTNIANRNQALREGNVDSLYFLKEISFERIYDALIGNLDSMSIDAVIFKQKEKLYKALEEYYFDYSDLPNIEQIYERQLNIVEQMNSLETEEVIRELKYMNPHIELNEKILQLDDLPSSEHLKVSIIKMFAEIERELESDKLIYVKENDTYKPTSIISESLNSVARNIAKNTNKSMFSTYKYYITEHLTNDLSRNPKVSEYEIDPKMREADVTKRRLPKLISLTETKDVLN